MASAPRPVISPITDNDVDTAAAFLHAEMTSRVPAVAWSQAVSPPWDTAQPNHGFMLRQGERVVGVYLALYVDRLIDGQVEQFCNLAAWCVLDDFRADGLRLLRSLLAQKGYHFTDFSPSGNVVALNERLGFTRLDTATALRPNLPWPLWPGRTRLVTDPAPIEQLLDGEPLRIFRDHRHATARRLLIVRGDRRCLVLYRRDRRKGLPLFASVLYASDPALFSQEAGRFFRHLLLRKGIPFTLAELRVTGYRPALSLMLKTPRPKMFRSTTLRPEQIDYLYSELTCVEW